MGTDMENVLAADKRRAVARLQELENEHRVQVAQLREEADLGLTGRSGPIIRAEARADAFALARDIVEGKWW